MTIEKHDTEPPAPASETVPSGPPDFADWREPVKLSERSIGRHEPRERDRNAEAWQSLDRAESQRENDRRYR